MYNGTGWVNALYTPITNLTGAAELPVGTTLQRPSSPTNGMIRYNSTIDVYEVYSTATTSWRIIPLGDIIVQAATNGEQVYNTPGTHSWVCPAGVTAVCVLVIGGGGGGVGATAYNGGGAGGGLAYLNNISVTPGQSYTVVVGAGGTPSNSGADAGAGGQSYFKDTSTLYANGGEGGQYNGPNSAGGTAFYVSGIYGSGAANTGGAGGYTVSTSAGASGGGGAAGYSGSGGQGGNVTSSGVITQPSAGSGGGGGGGGSSSAASYTGGGGGGVGIYGAGTNGTAGASQTSTINGTPGGGGSGGTTPIGTPGGMYGGGGAGADSTGGGGLGGSGVVRIIWGPNRAFPSTNTGVL